MVEESEGLISSEPPVEDGPWKSPRLSKNVTPVLYRLIIYPKIQTSTLQGQVLIDISVSNPTPYILIHQTNLIIESTKLLTKPAYEEVTITKTWSYPKNHYFVIELDKGITPGMYELQMKFKGNLSSCTLGLYKSTYQNDGAESSCILSYFEATYARSAFPCFDEPSFRAVFVIHISHDMEEKLVALSNSCREKETENYPTPGVKTVQFKPTPPLPPYLVAIIVGEFSYTKPTLSKSNVSVAVYSRPEIVFQMSKAQELAVLILDFFSEYFDVPYALPKLDLIALPDSNIGGMENWGMITFREDRLLLNENSTCDDLFSVINIIAHEISHMWFGDLVTISWWDNLWLKEGFATYMACVAGAKLFPEWYNDWASIRYSAVPALQMDAPFGSHPLVQTVNTTAEVREVFDSISYSKGSCLVRMLEDLDSNGFQRAIRSYLKRYQLSSTETENLWKELQEHVKYDVTSFMDTWTKQMGYPVLDVQFCISPSVTVSQSRFLQNKHSSYDPSSSPFGYKWNIPIKYITSNDLKNPKLIWLDKDLESVAPLCGTNKDWIKLNWHQVGFYRVNYPADMWDLFSVQLIRNPGVLDVEDRANLIDDAFNLACSGYFHYNIPLNLLRYLKFGKENHFLPWSVALPYLQYIGARLADTEGHAPFLKFIHLLLEDNLTNDIWNFDDTVPFLQKKLQLELIKFACWSEELQTLEKIKSMFTNWLDNQELPHPEIRSLVYSYGLSGEVTEEVWTKVFTMLDEVTDVKENLSLWKALGSVKNEDYLKALIEKAKDINSLKSQNFFIVLNSIARYPLGLQIVWDFLRDEWEYLINRFTLEDPDLCRSVYWVCTQFGTKERLQETMNFFGKHPDAGAGDRLRKMGLEKIKINIDWSEKNKNSIVDWLKISESEEFLKTTMESYIIN